LYNLLQAINKLAEAMQVLGLRHAPNRQQHQQQQALVNSQQQQQQAAATAAGAAANGTQQQQQQEVQQQPVRWAIDIGACPGGWTSYLADSCGYNVLAVDPAPLHPDVTARPRVRQILGRAQEVGEQVDEALAGQQVRWYSCMLNTMALDWCRWVMCCSFCGKVLCMVAGAEEVAHAKWHCMPLPVQTQAFWTQLGLSCSPCTAYLWCVDVVIFKHMQKPLCMCRPCVCLD
jgi:23S rRNA U2552 (ribose-2'-O)-methylase RlmE/FtsJ